MTEPESCAAGQGFSQFARSSDLARWIAVGKDDITNRFARRGHR